MMLRGRIHAFIKRSGRISLKPWETEPEEQSRISSLMPWYVGLFPLSYPCILYNLPVLKPWDVEPKDPGSMPWPSRDPGEVP